MSLGPELHPDPGCDNAELWAAPGGWSISGGKGIYLAGADNGNLEIGGLAFEIGHTYRFSVEVSESNFTAPGESVELLFDGGTIATITGNGTVSVDSIYESVANATGIYVSSMGAGHGLKVDNFSVREVLPDGGIPMDVFEEEWGW